jgi:putative ABC transport system permease protein
VTQIALALVLLIGSGLMIRTFQALRNVQPGFNEPEHVQMFRIFIPQAQVQKPELVVRMQEEILNKLAALPGVKSVAFGNSAPLEGFNSNDLLYAQDKNYGAGEIPPIRRFRFVSPGFAATTGTRLIAGRDFSWTDVYDLRNTAIVSENLAREWWGSPADALGKRVREGMKDSWREVVGVVGDVYDNGVQEKAPTMVYWPSMMEQFWGEERWVQRSVTFVIRSDRAGTENFLNEVRKTVWDVNANLPVYFVRTLQEVYDRSLSRTSFTLVMLAIAGGMALLLGIVGIYGVISYAVSQRTREVGIRLALGAPRGELAGMFVRYGLVLAGIGIAIGLTAAIALTRFMKSLLFEISPLDPITYLGVAVALVLAAVVASYLPAGRTAGVDPVEALRAE